METPILARIDQPADLKQLSLPELTQLASELRHVLLNKVSQTGGHVGPNLGVVELTIAFHTIFNSPVDKVVWDVSHQSYTHKILTGRKQAWLDLAHYNDVSGYTAPEESPHDYFNIGHTSTSIALATGMAVARDLEGKTGNVMAVIGDGSLSGGLALEGLNIAATLKSNLIILVNDNGMAIAEDHGGIYQNLRELRETNGTSSHNLFKDFGLDYRYVDDGNDLETMLTTFKEIKDVDHPIVLHVHTEKGHGYQPAITNKEAFHWHVPFDLATGQTLHPNTKETYTDVIHATLADELAAKTPITAITAAVPGTYDLKRFARQYPDRYFDVGIAEQESITFAAGQAQQGLRPIVFHSGTFLQRAYDQLSHDLGINKLPVTIMVAGGRINAGDPTHQGIFDVAMLSNIPNLTYLAPTTKEELQAMMHWALHQNNGPVAIRVPSNDVQSVPLAPDFDATKMHTLHAGQQVALLGVGSLLPLATAVQQQLAEQHIDATLIDPRDISDPDTTTLANLKADHQLVVTVEEASLSGGFGEKVSRYYGNSAMHVLNFGAAKRFNDRETTNELRHEFKLTPDQIVTAITDQLAE
ncbi:1-deoxy-D-xylulose-5-phosphate synthase [Lactiplantibacillus plantarum]|jgi:1-deoxy-D-xylulose-5-phosphate synthase|uniref:1-deoxy-D-xylulose-5-phosphate synthase n=1 Tax=Lactiplantibacillus plantarum CMPG5300 TaxID=1304889 RepID=A0AAW3FM70_LACPN|nr:1-deoxy-D-xylulose-5-phosphate synthase [Lactiplantibacillus plantarum]ATI72028.1 1-deoxy-D-xylulose-5-phosphate synthase [Lactiplantibacillus plantarum]AUS71829.1 1-deoxy-D-xylulose-5-phosphate synthase [Lactiplantibacillus plantarum]KGH42188.1 1-deoxy-D-xylulose-5-phosphate synthase [Lactiplantibacillus plantarum CMPG5300]MCG0661627.1 1-deoxy-D-xylulose-5-phosphate synthase [Lactiplantibacillus plantarum]MCJ2383398.1 1-deoxy-D-xylulose-5-phosphate synthase [Lactiplantibacillus plantarum]